jgi:dihydropyrimidinase
VAAVGGVRPSTDAETIDVAGCYVLPGGVDPHGHLITDRIADATGAMLAGGTTTALTFTLPRGGEPLAEAIVRARDEYVPQARIDIGLQAYVNEPGRVTRSDLERVRELGARGVHVFLDFPELGLMASDRQLYELLLHSHELGLPVQVVCENGQLVEALVDEHVARGQTDARFFAASRPPEVEIESTGRTIAVAELAHAPVYLVHLSTARSIDLIRAARRRGQDVQLEVVTHHLVLDESRYEGADAGRYIMVPPLRSTTEIDALWESIRDGTLDAVGSDHSHVRWQPDPSYGDFRSVPYGVAGGELRVPLVLSEGLARGIPIERLVDVLAEQPARIFGLHPQKGTLLPGADADAVVWDPQESWVVQESSLHGDVVDSHFEGLSVGGRVRHVLARGEVVVRDGELVGEPQGRYLPAPPQ